MPQTIVDLSQSSKRVAPTLAHDLILGNPTRPAGERAGVASVEALKGIIGGFVPVTLGKASVSAQVSTWRATNLVIPSAGAWFLLLVDLPAPSGKLPDERRNVAAVACSFCGWHARPDRSNPSRGRCVLRARWRRCPANQLRSGSIWDGIVRR